MEKLSDTVRLNKFIASHLSIGRRQADDYIEKGRVKIDNNLARLGQQINPSVNKVLVDGNEVGATTLTFNYIMLHKPSGYVCSRRQQGTDPTIYSLLPKNWHHLKPVGRLDKETSGLLLLTNDGDFSHNLTHPSFHKTKIYEVELRKPLLPLHQQMINDHGISLEDGNSRLTLAKLHDGNEYKWQVTMHEGRNRQIRRTFGALGYSVIKLHRTDFGIYKLNDLAEGQAKQLSSVTM